MANFVLVHGAWSGGWAYGRIARRLRAAGHQVFTPTLTGLGERSHLVSPSIDLDTHIQDVTNVFLYEDLRDVILCGHSYGGMVITGVAARCADRIRTLFYLDAFVPANGQSLWDLSDGTKRDHLVTSQRDHPGLVEPFQADVAEQQLREGDPRKLSHQPSSTFFQAVKLTGDERRIRNRTYVYATKAAPTIFTQFYEALKDDPAWNVRTINTGHVAMAEDPDGLTAMLVEEIDR